MKLNTRGFTLVESLVAAAIFSITGLAASNMLITFNNKQTQSTSKLNVTQVEGQILAMVGNRSIWTKNLVEAGVMEHPTISGAIINPELACLREGTDCTASAAGYDLTLLDQSGKIVVDGIDTTKGFTESGAVCSGFSATTPNPKCPWRLAIKWQPKCQTGTTCPRPQIAITMSIQANPNFLQASNLSSSAVSLTIQQPKPMPTFARRALVLTNSLHYGFTSDIEIDPRPYLVSDSPGKIVFSIPKTTSAKGGTVGMNGQKLTYSPNYNISPAPAQPLYGTDWFSYKIKDMYTGLETVSTVYVQVMTPYTWTGLANNSNITTKTNFCGKVVNGVCDGNTFPGSPFMAGVSDTNLVFNELCTTCTVTINSTISPASIETTAAFPGVINQNADVLVGGSGSIWKKDVSFLFVGGTWNGNAGVFVNKAPGESHTCWLCMPAPNTGFSILGGTFNAPPVVIAISDLYMPNANAFKHRNGNFYWMGMWQFGDTFTGDSNVEFWNLTAGYPKEDPSQTSVTVDGWTYGFGWPARTFVADNFIVRNNLTVANVGGEAQLASKNDSSVKLYGDYILPTANSGGCYQYGLPATVKMVGTGDQKILGQTLTLAEKKDAANANGNCSPSLVVDKPSGKITVKDTIVSMGSFVIKNAGSYEMDNVDLVIPSASFSDWHWSREINLKGNPINGFFYNGGRVVLSDDVIVTDNFQYAAPGISALMNADTTMRTIHIRGNASFADNATYDHSYADKAATLMFDGTGNQVVDSAMISSPATSVGSIANNFDVKKTAGTITFNGSLGVMQDFMIDSGNVVFGPTFGIHNRCTGADYIRTRIKLSDPTNQVIPTLTTNRTVELLSPVYVKNLVSNAVGDWIGPHYSNFYGGTNELYVSNDIAISSLFGPANLGARTSTQKIILNGTSGPQSLSIGGPFQAGMNDKIELIVKTNSFTSFLGSGLLNNITVDATSAVKLDTSSTLTVNGVVNGTFNKQGATMLGTLTGSGHIID